MPQADYTDKLIRRLESIHVLDPADIGAIQTLPLRIKDIDARQDIVREGDSPSRCCILFEGMACWYKTTGEGGRQIMAFQIPGDIPDLHSVHLEIMDSSLLTITPCKVGFVEHEAIRDICGRRPRIASAFWRMTLIDGSILREWVANVGRRKAYVKVAHLLCEQVVRHRAVGLGNKDGTYTLPLTQLELADAVGLSSVHVNRALQALRKSRLIEYRKYALKVMNWEGLREAGDFDQTYLFLTSGDQPTTSA